MKSYVKSIVALFLIVMLIFGVAQLFFPLGRGQVSSVGDEAYWRGMALNAWQYFAPGASVFLPSGLHSAGIGYGYFTDWDLGAYIQAIIDVESLGIISRSGEYGADWRFDKILTFLENRQLNSRGLPFVWYEAYTGNPYGSGEQNACDAGKLLVALKNLRDARPDYASRIDYIVYNKTSYEPLKQAVDWLEGSRHMYNYYVACGFAGFWPSRFDSLADSLLSNIVSAPTITAYGVALPKANILDEVLLHCLFELPSNAQFQALTSLIYQAHEARYTQTGKYTAFSEGNSGLGDPNYIYEWVVTASGRIWSVDDGSTVRTISPVVFFKAAVGLLAFNNTAFTRAMVASIAASLPTSSYGYADGVDENGRVITNISDKTNGLIIEAAKYAINVIVAPTPTPSPSPSPTPTPTAAPTPSPTPTPTVTPNPTPTASPTPTLTPTPTMTPTPTPTSTSTVTPTETPAVTPSVAPTPSVSPSPTPTATAWSTASPTASASPTPTGTIAPSASADPSQSVLPSGSASSTSAPPIGTSDSSTFAVAAVIAVVVVGASLALVYFKRKT